MPNLGHVDEAFEGLLERLRTSGVTTSSARTGYPLALKQVQQFLFITEQDGAKCDAARALRKGEMHSLTLHNPC